MAQVIWDDMPVSPGIMTPDIQEEPEAERAAEHPDGGPLPTEQAPKLKGRRRLMDSLKRMSSSPSLAKFGRTSSSSSAAYMGGGRASISCVSLSSASSRFGHAYGTSYSSTQSSGGFSTAPTSIAGTPVPDDPGLNNRLRRLDGDVSSHVSALPKTVSLPLDIKSGTREISLSHLATSGSSANLDGYFARPLALGKAQRKRRNFQFWEELPGEIRVQILRFLKPKELVRCSMVSKSWEKMCFDGQLWINLDTEQYYRDIPATSLTKIMTQAGPFIRDLNLRGCVQMPERWGSAGHAISNACRNIENFSLEGCRIDRSSVHHFLIRNPRLVHINLCGLRDVCNSTMRIIAQGCPQLEHLNVSWCHNVDTRGLVRVVQACSQLKDLRVAEIEGFNDKAFLLEIFERNTLERLILSHCIDLDDQALRLLIEGEDPKTDILTEQAIVPPRNLRHLDLSRCKALTGNGIRCLAGQVPNLVGLQLSHCNGISDDALTGILASSPLLTHLDLEELDELTNTTLIHLANSPCAPNLLHLNISYCENIGDVGMLQIFKRCPRLKNVVMDNTRVSDLVLTEAAAQSLARDRQRINNSLPPLPSTAAGLDTTTEPVSVPAQTLQHQQIQIPPSPPPPPQPTLHIVIYDCQNVTWTGIREILCSNTHPNRSSAISLKCFYGYQDTVDEHMKRVVRGDRLSAERLERKWAEYMMAGEEAGAQGAAGVTRRRRRRLREAMAAMRVDEEEEGPRGGRRRARSSGCAVM